MTIEVDVQRLVASPVSDEDIHRWVESVLAHEHHDEAELTVRIVDEVESASLNQQYRHKTGPTNVLSFPFQRPVGIPAEIKLNLLGDLVICAPVVKQQAQEQNKAQTAHWAHMVVHGVLHLLGYDHIKDSDAERMEQREIEILHTLGYTNPYQINDL